MRARSVEALEERRLPSQEAARRLDPSVSLRLVKDQAGWVAWILVNALLTEHAQSVLFR